MRNHTDLINLIAQVIGAKTYVEIGVYNPDHNFNQVEVQNKVGIDPDPNAGASMTTTSDKAFALFRDLKAHADLIFIDGLHHADQVKLDIENAWNCLNPGGVIVLHDCNPPTEDTTCVPRGKQREWCGDVYKTICNLYVRPKFTVDFDYGCCVIRKIALKEPGPAVPGSNNGEFVAVDSAETNSITWNDKEITWGDFTGNRKELLNLVSVDEAVQIINTWNKNPVTGN